ncbi:MAG: UvrD-helicase domain-containing protein [Desulfobacteraceae bacterium]|nr:UvrD-helicase domain-containing protein [Desulfobacteraceae bacterium]
MELTPSQDAAVKHLGSPALVVAGAGSGKTRTLTSKISHLISQGMAPERIMAITFTNKAADEMKGRLVHITGFPLNRFPWVRTYHSACLQILKQHHKLLGFTYTPQIYTPYQQEKIIKEILIDMNFDKKHTRGVLYQISLAKNSGRPERWFDETPSYSYVPLPDVYHRYENALRSRTAMDFDNILIHARDVLRDHDSVRQQYQAYFSYVLVDEYQDTNDLQEELTGLLMSNGNLFCVGDDWQAIYSFRGSNVNHFLAFEDKYPGATMFRLEQNFRSADEIVKVANDVILRNESRVEKKCFSDKKGGVVAIHEFGDETDEAGWVAMKIQVLKRQGIPYDRLAVLYRTKFCSLAFEQRFRAGGIPYQMLGGKGFFERKEILDLVSYLTVARFEMDDVSFERIINTPKRGIGPGTLKKIIALKQDGSSLIDAARRALREKILSPKIYNGLKAMVQLIDDIKTMKPANALAEVINRVDYLDYLEGYAKGNKSDMTTRKENIDQLVYSASKKETMEDFLEEVSLVKEDKEADEEEMTHGVKLSTIHASKGLEYHAVFVIGCEEQLFPHWKSMETPAEIEEERRLMYVSMTRAEKYLYLTCAGYRRGQFNPRSRFLAEIEESLE